MGLLEANLRVYFKELGASCMFELVQIPNADAEHEHFPFLFVGTIIILQMLRKLTPPTNASTSHVQIHDLFQLKATFDRPYCSMHTDVHHMDRYIPQLEKACGPSHC